MKERFGEQPLVVAQGCLYGLFGIEIGIVLEFRSDALALPLDDGELPLESSACDGCWKRVKADALHLSFLDERFLIEEAELIERVTAADRAQSDGVCRFFKRQWTIESVHRDVMQRMDALADRPLRLKPCAQQDWDRKWSEYVFRFFGAAGERRAESDVGLTRIAEGESQKYCAVNDEWCGLKLACEQAD